MVKRIIQKNRQYSARQIHTDPVLHVLALKGTPVAIAILHGRKYIFSFANPLFCQITGKAHIDIINKPVWHAFPEVKGQGFEKLLDNVLTTGIPYIESERPVKIRRQGQLETAYYSFVFNPVRDAEGDVNEIMVIATEVTDKVRMDQAVKAERQHFYNLLMQAPAIVAILKGPKHILEFANPQALQTIGIGRDVIGKPLIEALPEMKQQAFIRILNTVYKTRKAFIGNEVPAMLDRHKNGILEKAFYNFVYQPNIGVNGEIKGIFVHAVDVTDQVMSHKKVKEKEKQLWNILESISDAFISYDKKWRYTYVNKEASRILGRNPEDLIGKVVWKVFPESRTTESGRNFLKAARTGKPIFFQTYYPPFQKWFEVRVYPGKDGVSTTFRDLTQHEMHSLLAKPGSPEEKSK